MSIYKRCILILIILIIIPIFIIACSNNSEPKDNAPLEGEITDIASEFTAELSMENYEAAYGYFDANMKTALPVNQLEKTWQGLIDQVGTYKDETGKRTDVISGYNVVFVTTQFENALIDIRIVFNEDKRIAGLFFETADGGEAYSPPPYAQTDQFTETDVTIGSGKWILPGTLTLPKGESPFPAVVLVHGSGANDRDETIGPNKPFKDLAWGLASQGIAVLRYEKRTFRYKQEMSAQTDSLTVKEETIDDALAAIDLLNNNSDIDSSRIFVLGHSLGGTLAPRIGTQKKEDAAGLIILAGAARPLEDLILEQTAYLFNLDGLTAEEEAQLKEVENQVNKVKDPNLSQEVPASDLPLGIAAAYWLDLQTYDAVDTALNLGMPVFILQGERDYQVTMDDFSIWKAKLSGLSQASFKSYPKLNHLFLSGESPSEPAEYQQPGNIPEEVINDISIWVNNH